ncbi:hypothetical protein GS966_11230 [Rhodococcus hoagii]|nr:hypothetical protein [Prescottella equi]
MLEHITLDGKSLAEIEKAVNDVEEAGQLKEGCRGALVGLYKAARAIELLHSLGQRDVADAAQALLEGVLDVMAEGMDKAKAEAEADAAHAEDVAASNEVAL